MNRTMFLFEDRVPAGAKPIYLPRGNRSIYVRSGAVSVGTFHSAQYLPEGSAVVEVDEITLASESSEAVLWRWELAGNDEFDETPFVLRSAPESTSELKLKASFDFDERYSWLMRCDTVEFPPGGIAFTHLHQGPGIRIAQSGEITIDTEGTIQTYGPNSAWAEKGIAPVYAPTTDASSTLFVRCFLLPRQNMGSSSIRFVHSEDRARTNTQKYRILMERAIDV